MILTHSIQKKWMNIQGRPGKSGETQRPGRSLKKNPKTGLVQKLRDFITEHYYQCTPEILRGLGEMYAGGNSFTDNIDSAGGEGTAEFVKRAIDVYCSRE